MGLLVAPTAETGMLLLRRVISIVQRHFAHRIIEVSENERRLVVHNLGGGQTTVVAKAGDNPTSFPIEAVDWLVVDGAEWLREGIWSTHLAPLLIEKQGRALVLGVPIRGEWFRELIVAAQDGAPGYESWSRPSIENPAVEASVVEHERQRMPPELFAALFEGRFVGRGAVRCPVCGGPDPEAQMVVVLKNDEALARCQCCGNPVDATGRPIGKIGADGQLQLQIVVVQAPKAPPSDGLQSVAVPPPPADS